MTESRFSRDVLTLVTGTTVSLIITLLASPIITRLYGPAAFGLLALFTSITGILGVIVCLRYELAIVLPKTDEEAANIFGLCMLLVVLVSHHDNSPAHYSAATHGRIPESPATGSVFLADSANAAD